MFSTRLTRGHAVVRNAVFAQHSRLIQLRPKYSTRPLHIWNISATTAHPIPAPQPIEISDQGPQPLPLSWVHQLRFVFSHLLLLPQQDTKHRVQVTSEFKELRITLVGDPEKKTLDVLVFEKGAEEGRMMYGTVGLYDQKGFEEIIERIREIDSNEKAGREWYGI